MNSPRGAVSLTPSPNISHRNKPWTVLSSINAAKRPEPQKVQLTRRYDVEWIDDDGQIDSFTNIAPAIPVFEQAFSAFAHGAIVSTKDGPVAVEDLEPGAEVETSTGDVVPLRWKGTINVIPNAPTHDEGKMRLYRVTSDSLGLGRPSSDVTFGPNARILNRDPAIRNALGSEAALAPISQFADGVGVFEMTPVSPVRVYHLAFDGHHVIRVGGLEVESYHPGPDAHYSMSCELRNVFLSLFPHVATMQGFGRVLWPRFESVDDGGLEIV